MQVFPENQASNRRHCRDHPSSIGAVCGKNARRSNGFAGTDPIHYRHTNHHLINHQPFQSSGSNLPQFRGIHAAHASTTTSVRILPRGIRSGVREHALPCQHHRDGEASRSDLRGSYGSRRVADHLTAHPSADKAHPSDFRSVRYHVSYRIARRFDVFGSHGSLGCTRFGSFDRPFFVGFVVLIQICRGPGRKVDSPDDSSDAPR